MLKIWVSEPTKSMADIGREVGVSRERVRQILKSEGHQSRPRLRNGKYRKEYQCWWGMLDRCLNPQNKVFPHYGGRGISVCKRWMNFDKFFEDMGQRPDNNFSIERVNNDGGYNPSNCKWATRAEQAQNTRATKLNPAKVAEIRSRHAAGDSAYRIAKDNKVTVTTILRIVRIVRRVIPDAATLESELDKADAEIARLRVVIAEYERLRPELSQIAFKK